MAPITSLKSTGWHEPTIGGFSPDGRFLVYSLPNDDGGHGAVFALAVDGSREVPLVQNSANNWAPLWSPDGGRVVFLSNRSGIAGLWSIRVADGRPQGEPELVRANMVGTTPLGFTKDGSYYYRAGNLWRDAYTAELDPDTLAISKPTLVTDRFVGSNFDPALSPDGKYIAFLRRVVGSGPGAGQSLIVRSMTQRRRADGRHRRPCQLRSSSLVSGQPFGGRAGPGEQPAEVSGNRRRDVRGADAVRGAVRGLEHRGTVARWQGPVLYQRRVVGLPVRTWRPEEPPTCEGGSSKQAKRRNCTDTRIDRYRFLRPDGLIRRLEAGLFGQRGGPQASVDGHAG